MEENIKRAQKISILGGICFSFLAFMYVLDVLIYGINFSYSELFYFSAYVLFLIFFFMNKAQYLMLIPTGLMLIITLLNGVSQLRNMRYISGIETFEDFLIVNNWTFAPILFFVVWVLFAVSASIASSRKTKAINSLWFVPAIVYALPSLLDFILYTYSFVSYLTEVDKVNAFRVVTGVFQILWPVVIFIGIVALGAWLQAKNEILREYGFLPGKQYIQPQFGIPQYQEPAYQQPQPQYQEPAYQQPQPQYQEPIYQQPTNEDNFTEIKKYKELLDSGIISEEEFEKKKRELLNL